MHVHRIEWSACREWQRNRQSIHHASHRYFSVVFVSDGRREYLLVDQQEVGILGFVFASQGGERYWLLQAKPEPGNVGFTQWAPTVQATRSNYERVHGGSATPMLDLFLFEDRQNFDVLGSEQGDRFLNKFNRNAKREFEEPWQLGSDEGRFAWRSSGEVKQMLREDYQVNTDARSVLASGAWGLLAECPGTLFLGSSLPEELRTAFHRSSTSVSMARQAVARSTLVAALAANRKTLRSIPLGEVTEYRLAEDGIYDRQGGRVVGYFDCWLPNREVPRWQQPLVERAEVCEFVLLFILRDGLALFNVAAYAEVGYLDRAEFGPSIQTGEGACKVEPGEMSRLLLDAEVLLQIHQSDEGGRFYRNIGRYVVARWHGDPASLDAPHRTWLSLGELERFSLEQGLLSNELRTLLSLVLSLA